MGNRHMATERTHNRVHRQRKGGRGLTPAERRARAHGIHNRGEGAEMNGEQQKRLRALDGRLKRLAEQIATLHRELKDERLKRQQMSEELRRYADKGVGLVADAHEQFRNRGLVDRLRWLLTGN